MHVLRRLLEHPIANLVVAIILIVTSFAEGWETLREDVVKLDAGAHHGVLLFGFVNLLRTIPELFEAVERGHKAGERAA